MVDKPILYNLTVHFLVNGSAKVRLVGTNNSLWFKCNALADHSHEQAGFGMSRDGEDRMDNEISDRLNGRSLRAISFGKIQSNRSGLSKATLADRFAAPRFEVGEIRLVSAAGTRFQGTR